MVSKLKVIPNFLSVITLGTVFCLALPSEAETEKKESYYSQLTRAVVRLEQKQSTCVPGLRTAIQRSTPIGSAFFVHDSFEGKSRYFIVTARHNVDVPGDLFVRVQTGPAAEQSALLLLPKSLWVFHPAPTRPGHLPIDVAVMQIIAPPFIKAFLNCPSGGKNGECGRHEKTKKPRENQLGETPSVLSHAVFLGFPGGGETAVDSLEPMARGGVVAYTAYNPSLHIGNRRIEADSVYLVDATSLPGNSGGPVLKELTPFSGGVTVWGLVTATNHLGRYTIVTRPEKMAETLAYARQVANINDRWSTDLPPLPSQCTVDEL